MRASDSKWPFRPDHITNDGEKLQGTELVRLNGVGIISNEYLQGIQKAICATLENPTTIVEFSPGGDFIRNDSRLLVFGLHPARFIFRKYTYGKKCFECDKTHADLFRGLNKDNLIKEVGKRIEDCKYINDYRKEDKEIYLNFVKNAERPYLEYDCPLLGYRELVFPIFFEKKVIGVFFMGDLCLENRLEFIEHKQKELSTKHSHYFLEYCEKNLGCRSKGVKEKIEDMMEEILARHLGCVSEAKQRAVRKIYKDKQYRELQKNICIELDGLEKTLVDQMASQRIQYVRGCIDERIREFRERLLSESSTHDERPILLLENFQKCLMRLVKDFAMRYVLVFGSDTLTRGKVEVLDVVAKAGQITTELEETIRQQRIKFNLNKLTEDIRNEWITSTEDKRIFNAIEGFPEELGESLNLVRVFPVPLFPQATLVVLVGYNEDNSLANLENEPVGPVDMGLQSFFMVVLSALSAVLAGAAEERREKELGRLTHELKVPLVAIRGAAEFMKRTPGIDKFFDYDYPGDVWSWSELMGRLIDNADAIRYSGKMIQIKPTRTHILKDVIAPAIRQVRLLLDEREFSRFNIRYKHEHFEQIPKLWLDRNGFQQVVFNLLSNAIKYAYDEPDAFEVEIDAGRRGKEFVIWFRDWGPGIEAGIEELIFEEGFRAENALKRNVTGQGLGLWVSRQIVERHSGSIKVTNLQFPMELEISLPSSLRL